MPSRALLPLNAELRKILSTLSLLVLRLRVELDVTSSKTRFLALLNNLINGIEFLISDCECDNCLVALPDVHDEHYIVELEFVGCRYDAQAYLPRDLRYIEEFKLGTLSFGEVLGNSVEFRDLYSIARKLIFELATENLLRFSIETQLTGYEYALICNRNGSAVIISGERNKLVFPKVPLPAFIAHIHRYTALPSSKDLEQALDVLSNGGLAIVILTTSRYSMISRIGPMTEEDYESLCLFRDFMMSPRSPDEVFEYVKRLLFRGIRVELDVSI